MSGFFSDLRQASRALWRNAGMTALAVSMLALGIGATTAIFSVFYSVLLQPLPFTQPDRLVQIWETRTQHGWDRASFTQANFWDLRDRNRTFEEIGAFRGGDANLTGFGDPEHLQVGEVSAGYFRLLGVSPVAGRIFLPADDRPGGGNVALLSSLYWRRRFGADPGIVGQMLRLDGKSYEVVGVLSPGEPLLNSSQVFVPLVYKPDANRGSFEFQVIGRLKPGVTIEAARADLASVCSSLAQQYPKDDAGMGVRLGSSREWMADDSMRRALWVLLGAVGFLLLIACVNLANLLLARATQRSREIAVRAALGATRARIIRFVLTESLLLGLIGAAAGLLLAQTCIEIIRASDPGGIPRLTEISLNPWVLGFTLLVAILTGVCSGIAPAFHTPYHSLVTALREGDRTQAGSRSQRRLQSVLVAAEVALSLVLLIGAGLMMRSFSRLLSVQRGFETENRLVAAVDLPSTYNAKRTGEFLDQLIPRLEAAPGILAAAGVQSRPLGGLDTGMGIVAADKPLAQGAQVPWASWRFITPSYFRAMGIPLLKGRAFTGADVRGKPWRVVISQSLADLLWPGEDPIGRQAILWKGQSGPPAEVIGVVGSMRERGLDENPTLAVYIPYNGSGWTPVQVILHTSGNPAAAVSTLRSLVSEIDPALPVSDALSMEYLVDRSLSPRRFNTALMGFFAAAALLLALAGIYGVLAFSVARRTSEIGVRVALGASPRSILALVIGQGLRPILVGIAVGLAGALALSRLLTSLLFDVKPADPLTYAAVSSLVVAAALVACYIPARRALNVDPVKALREE